MTIFSLHGAACEIARDDDGRYLISVVAPDQRWHEASFATYGEAHAAVHRWVAENVPAGPKGQRPRAKPVTAA